METTNESKVHFERKPIEDIRFKRSKSGRHIIVEVVQTWIFSSKYFDALSKNSNDKNEISSTV
jgi:hypothetical protein